MRSLKDYLNNTQQYEGILDPDQNQVIDRMTDDAIRRCIREYCTWERQEHQYSVLWPAADVNLKITKIDKDKQGWYIETSSVYAIFLIYNEKKAKILYDFLDESKLFKGTVRKEDRSLMNVPFVTGSDDLDAKFVKEAKEAGFENLKGHRTVGGMRASIYNAMPIEGVEKLVAFMREFEKNNG